jgi:hypothetical protein
MHQLESSVSWDEFVNKSKDSRGDLHPDIAHIPHGAAHLLNLLRVLGATVETKTEPWFLKQKIAALTQGSHQSSSQHVAFLCSEFVDMINKGQWILLLARLLIDARNLRMSPLGVVTQQYHRPVLNMTTPSIL